MKTILGIGILLGTLAGGLAQTNNLTGLLQQGLFEEQANRNLEAAIADYQTLATQFDKDRQLAATAVFRLGECYRAQGRTNEAAMEYQRIIREFGDQQMLATLSRQDLAGMGMAGPEATAVAQPAGENPDLRMWEKLQATPFDQLVRILPTVLPDASLDALLQQRTEAQEKLTLIQADYSTSNIVYVRQKALVDEIDRQTQEKISGMLQGLKLRAEVSRPPSVDAARQRQIDAVQQEILLTAKNLADTELLVKTGQETQMQADTVKINLVHLQAELAQLESQPGSAQVQAPAAGSEEDQEIARIQQMIQNSPDLINAPSDGSTPLARAAYHGWLKVAAYLLDHGADVNVVSPDIRWSKELTEAGQLTPLSVAVLTGNKAMTQFLIERGADINFKSRSGYIKGRTGYTPLHLAVQQGFQTVAEALLASHADVSIPDSDGLTPLLYAVQNGRSKIVQMLLAAGADINAQDNKGWTALNYSIGLSPEILQVLLVAGLNPNTKDAENRTPLSYAVEQGTMDMVKALLADKADPNAGDRAPLLLAVYKNDCAVAEVLLQAGAHPDTAGKLGFQIAGDFDHAPVHASHLTPLWVAIRQHDLAMEQLLLKYKADPNNMQTDKECLLFPAQYDTNALAALLEAGAKADYHTPDNGWSPLSLAVQNNNLVAVQLLLKFKADPNHLLLRNNPLLFTAIYNTNILEALLDAGAEVDVRTTDEANWTPLANAANQNLTTAVEILLKHGANPNVRNSNGATPLHWAAYQCVDTNIFEMLLDHGADPNVRSSNGRTPLDELKVTMMDHGGWPARFNSYEAKAARCEELIAALHAHGALDNPPDWNSIIVSRPAADFSFAILHKATNDWNHFALLETLENFYFSSQLYWRNSGGSAVSGMLPFPDLTHVVVVRPNRGSTNETRMLVNLLNSTNGIDCSKDVPLEFGDVVEVPERDHALGDNASGLTGEQAAALGNYVKGSVQLVVRDKKVQIPIYGLGNEATLDAVLANSDAQNILLASSDLSRVKVIRHEAKAGEQHEWTFDCRAPGNNNAPGTFSVSTSPGQPMAYQWNLNNGGNDSPSSNGFWLRNGDVIEVPEKQ